MAVDEKIIQILDPKRLPLPPNPPVAEIQVEEYVDTSGEDALRVWVVMPDEFDVEQITGDDVLALKSAIRRTLREAQVELYPYIHLVTASERQQDEVD